MAETGPMVEASTEHWRRAVMCTFAGIFAVSALGWARRRPQRRRRNWAAPWARAGRGGAHGRRRHAGGLGPPVRRTGARTLPTLSDLPPGWVSGAAAAAPTRLSPWSTQLASCVGVPDAWPPGPDARSPAPTSPARTRRSTVAGQRVGRTARRRRPGRDDAARRAPRRRLYHRDPQWHGRRASGGDAGSGGTTGGHHHRPARGRRTGARSGYTVDTRGHAQGASSPSTRPSWRLRPGPVGRQALHTCNGRRSPASPQASARPDGPYRH